MKFDLKKSKLLFEVRYKNKNYSDVYTYEMLYKREDGKYFINFEGGKFSPYAIKIGYSDFAPRSGNFFIDDIEIELWKSVACMKQKDYPKEYMVIDWEKEEEEAILDEIKLNDEYMMTMGNLSESELPF